MERFVQILDHLGDDLGLWCWLTEPIRSSVEGADARLLRDYGLGLVPNQRPAE